MKSCKVLFLCTGNYYRSRFAEILFNHLCRKANLPHVADSRALAIERGSGNVGPLSRHTREALEARQIPLPAELRMPRQAEDQDFAAADLVIAVKEQEHRPLVEQRYPLFTRQVRYWHVHDLDCAQPDQAMREIEAHVRELVRDLSVAEA